MKFMTGEKMSEYTFRRIYRRHFDITKSLEENEKMLFSLLKKYKATADDVAKAYGWFKRCYESQNWD